jgi:recombinational DNA repair protein (RecF pathway)
MKICSICGDPKDFSEYYPEHAKCISCYNEQRKAKYKANKKTIRRKLSDRYWSDKVYRKAIQQSARDYYWKKKKENENDV